MVTVEHENITPRLNRKRLGRQNITFSGNHLFLNEPVDPTTLKVNNKKINRKET